MKRRVRVERDAEAELQAAAEWYELQDPEIGLGSALLEAVAKAQEQIARGSHGSPVPGSQTGARRVPIERFPLWVVFIELPREATVVAYAHEKRRPGYWRRRSKGGA